MSKRWFGGENFIKVARGSKSDRAGGTNGLPCGTRKKRFYPTLMRQLGGGKFTSDARVRAAAIMDREVPFRL